MNKIVELLIDINEEFFKGVGVNIMSLVEKPAIGLSWQAFEEATHGMPDGSIMPGASHEGDPQLTELEKAIINAATELGEEYDPHTTIFLDVTRGEFATIGEVLEGIVSLDILSRSGVERDEPSERKYRYTGKISGNSRAFCRGMVRLNKIYTREEIDEITSRTSILNPDMGHNSSTYSVWNYKGGVNCRHYWESLDVFRNDSGQLVIVSNGPAAGDAGQIASSSNNNWRFNLEEDKMIVTGPVMIPQQLIPRVDELGNVFHVYFSKETIVKIAERFLKENTHNTDINHSDEITTENTLIESWIVEDPANDKANSMGYDVPAGSWFVSYKINNSDTWKKIKSKELNGYSITGDFLEKTEKI